MNARNARDRKEERAGEEGWTRSETKGNVDLVKGQRNGIRGWRINRGGIYKRVGENSSGTWVALSEGYCARGIVTDRAWINSFVAPHHWASIMRHIEFCCTGANHQPSYLLRFSDNRCSWLSRSLRLFGYITIVRYDDGDRRWMVNCERNWENLKWIEKYNTINIYKLKVIFLHTCSAVMENLWISIKTKK